MHECIDTVVSYDGWRDRVAEDSPDDSADAASKRAAVVFTQNN
ncbi:MAG: hypothetical protein O8C56_09010 [Candidatus Methanoperedens sp.]|nr:hypothetical protein [Candidatus Methanoperedens sp.]